MNGGIRNIEWKESFTAVGQDLLKNSFIHPIALAEKHLSALTSGAENEKEPET